MAERDLSPTPSGYRAGTCHLNNESMCPYVVPQSWGNFLRATSPSTLIHILGSSIFTYPLSIRSHRGPPQKSTARGALSREPLPIMSAEAGVPASGAHVQGYEPRTSVSNITAPPHTNTLTYVLTGKQFKVPEGPGEARRSTFLIFVDPWWPETAILLHSSSLKLLLISASISQGSQRNRTNRRCTHVKRFVLRNWLT